MPKKHPARPDGSRWCSKCQAYLPGLLFGKYVNALCTPHMREYSRERYQRNGDPGSKERARKRRAAKTEGYKQSCAKEYAKQKALGWPGIHKWRLKHQDSVNEYARNYQRDWYRKNPERAAAKRHRSRARKAGAAGYHTAQDLLERFSEFEGLCVYCGEKSPWLFDHQVPLVQGGSNFIWNLVPICKHCNSKKHAKPPIAFIEANARTSEIKVRLLELYQKETGFEKERYYKNPYEKVPLQAIKDDVLRIKALYGQVTWTTLSLYGKFSPSTYIRRLGGMPQVQRIEK